MIKIIIADDHTILRQGLRKMLEEEPGFEVVGEAADGFEAIEKVCDLKPHILVVDLVMPHLNGLEVTQRLKSDHPGLKIVVLSMRKSEPYIMEALRNGADGYVLKSEDPQDLINAIHTVLAGNNFLSPKVTNMAIDAYLSKSRQMIPNPYDSLTNREKEVLQLSVEGMANNEIADFLTISVYTVATHRRNLMGKLDVRNQADLLKFAIKQGIVSDDI